MTDVTEYGVASPGMHDETLREGKSIDGSRSVGLREGHCAIFPASGRFHIDNNGHVADSQEIGAGIQNDHIPRLWQARPVRHFYPTFCFEVLRLIIAPEIDGVGDHRQWIASECISRLIKGDTLHVSLPFILKVG